MTAKGYTRKFKPLVILSGEEVEAVHRATLDVLEVTGVRFESDRNSGGGGSGTFYS